MYDDLNRPPNQGQDMNQQQPISQNMNQTAQPGFSGGQPQKTSVAAILSLVFAFLFWPAGLILGIVAMVKISHNPNLKGKGLAIAGIIISVLWIPLILFMMVGSLAYFGAISQENLLTQGTFSPENRLSERCQFSMGLECTDIASIDKDAGTMSFPLTNSVGYDIKEMSIIASTCSEGSFSNDPLRNGDSMVVTLSGCDFSGEKYNEEMTLTYTSMLTGNTFHREGIASGSLQ